MLQLKLGSLKSWRYIAGIGIATLAVSCNWLLINGSQGVSQNIEESKKRGVFIAEYKPITNPIKINDSIVINVKEAWLENEWQYSGIFSEGAKKAKDLYCLVVQTDTLSLKNYESWDIGSGNLESFDKDGNYDMQRLRNLFEFIPSKDTLSWPVRKSVHGIEARGSGAILGTFTLVKKTSP